MGGGEQLSPEDTGEGAVHTSCHCSSAQLFVAECTDGVWKRDPTPLLASVLTGELWVANASALLPPVAQAGFL